MTSVSCGRNFIRVDLDRRLYDPSNYSTITFLDPKCGAKFSKAYITLVTMVHSCGGEKEVKDGKIIYKNKVIMTAHRNPDNNITRDYDVEMAFRCIYNQSGFVGGVMFQPVRKISGNESKFSIPLGIG